MQLLAVNDKVWAKIGRKYIGWYCPEKAFVSLEPRKTSIKIECFSGNEPINGAKVTNARFAPRWSIFYVKSDKDVEASVAILSESNKRIKEAISRGETTGYFSGGEPLGTPRINDMSGKDEESA